ncbi:(d)CMP kinase [Bacillus taeanensis]|uniref:Cytidylate kinase n=1 Tax=Bacillus taeanensis TaxID=273032 RepID=A0A366XV89_9BACI|nr:(d)CMP kinase [Bacillus taeanensis]RBW70300.1 (d)CMP kinase [Bacillus taeanensis]
MSKKINIALDGPAGAGKSTVAKKVAEELSYLYIDTGAMYRALTYKALQQNIELEDGEALKRLLDHTTIELKKLHHTQCVYLDHEDVTESIRSIEVTNNVSFTAKHSEVRQEMVKRQQHLAESGGVVMDGRDVGTHVLPNAEVKIFLVASVEERAKRRFEELNGKNIQTEFEQLKKEIELRDQRDSERLIAPLKKAADAIEIDSTSLSINEVVNQILTIVKERS